MKIKKVSGGGFTLPEILITIVVIGIIAAITINIINTNVKEVEITSKLKKTISVLNSAIYRASIDNGNIANWTDTKNLSTNEFLIKYIVPYLTSTTKTTPVPLKEMGYKTPIKSLNGNICSICQLDTRTHRIFLSDGTAIVALKTIEDSITKNTSGYIFIIDINGPKGPNILGKDVFELSLHLKAQSQTVQTYGLFKYNQNTGNIEENTIHNLITDCTNNGEHCGAIIQKQGWKITKDYPIKI